MKHKFKTKNARCVENIAPGSELPKVEENTYMLDMHVLKPTRQITQLLKPCS